jgi:hypothetical protein
MTPTSNPTRHTAQGRSPHDDGFRDFMFTNAVRFWGEVNPDFFKGTSVEKQAAEVLAPVRAWSRRAGHPVERVTPRDNQPGV